MHSKSQ